jgi:nickel transport protein
MKDNQRLLARHDKGWIFLGVGLMVLALAALAFAHAAVLWAYVEKNQVFVEAFFMGGAKVKNGRIVVLDKEGKKLLEGKTDEEGNFSFTPPVMDDMKIFLLIDKAHASEFEIKKEDFQEDEKSVQETAPLPTKVPK